MLSFGQPQVRAFGGAGVMIEHPRLRLAVEDRGPFEVRGPAAQRIRQFARQVCDAWGWPHPPDCRITCLESPREHAGFGAGTQLGLALAAALARCKALPTPAVAELARATGRARRSSIGTWGFECGGLIAEGGHEPGQSAACVSALSPRIARVELAPEWRWVVVTPASDAGLSGEPEREAFSRLPPVPVPVTERLCDELWYELLPAARCRDFEKFSASLYRYSELSGSCFAAVQGGAFAERRVASLVGQIRRHGVEGVGQSSWGPTVFAVVQNENNAQTLAERLRSNLGDARAEVLITATCNRGAEIVVRQPESR